MNTKLILRVAAVGLMLTFVISNSGCGLVRRAQIFPAARQCQENLAMIDISIEQWALEHEKGPNDVPTWAEIAPADRSGYMRERHTCPSGSDYTLTAVSQDSTCTSDLPGHAIKDIGLPMGRWGEWKE